MALLEIGEGGSSDGKIVFVSGTECDGRGSNFELRAVEAYKIRKHREHLRDMELLGEVVQ
jgi:hypothetical protein